MPVLSGRYKRLPVIHCYPERLLIDTICGLNNRSTHFPSSTAPARTILVSCYKCIANGYIADGYPTQIIRKDAHFWIIAHTQLARLQDNEPVNVLFEAGEYLG